MKEWFKSVTDTLGQAIISVSVNELGKHMGFTSSYFTCNNQKIHTMGAGLKEHPVILMLHGFPEYWKAWEGVAEQLSSDFRVILPDQRGFNFSSKPIDVEAYETKHLVADMIDLIGQVSPNEPIILCGHDWGAAVAYAIAIKHPEKISNLIIANGVHPICFQKALYAGGAQTDASQYMNVLRAEGSEDRLKRENFKPLLNMFQKFSSAPWLTENIRDQYREAWTHDNALPTMLNWYRSSPMVVPKPGATAKPLTITAEVLSKYRISMPHLLIWGINDVALLSEAREDLHKFCNNLEVAEIEDASHWILHERPKEVAKLIKAFAGRRSSTRMI